MMYFDDFKESSYVSDKTLRGRTASRVSDTVMMYFYGFRGGFSVSDTDGGSVPKIAHYGP